MIMLPATHCSARGAASAAPPSGLPATLATRQWTQGRCCQSRLLKLSETTRAPRAGVAPAHAPGAIAQPDSSAELAVGVPTPAQRPAAVPLHLQLEPDASPQELVGALCALADGLAPGADAVLSAASADRLAAAAPLLPALGTADLLRLLAAAAQLSLPSPLRATYAPAPSAAAPAATSSSIWRAALLAACRAALPACRPAQLAALLWSLEEMGAVPDAAFCTACAERAQAALQDFTAPQLAQVACSLGAMSSTPAAPEFLSALMTEVRYHVTEFPRDFEPTDLARLLNGLADLHAPVDPGLHTLLMRIVHSSVKSIEDRAAVDFALTKLGSDRSILFDARWTHEELHWLPRNERDKLKLHKAMWYRRQWGGF